MVLPFYQLLSYWLFSIYYLGTISYLNPSIWIILRATCKHDKPSYTVRRMEQLLGPRGVTAIPPTTSKKHLPPPLHLMHGRILTVVIPPQENVKMLFWTACRWGILLIICSLGACRGTKGEYKLLAPTCMGFVQQKIASDSIGNSTLTYPLMRHWWGIAFFYAPRGVGSFKLNNETSHRVVTRRIEQCIKPRCWV